ncbi:ribosomal protein S18 acetylase RimI-like enzyme [Streptacidiphilus sp. MAP12-16]|jgi:ribosomal protein S18 acetylase RimI-like enzyme|uniref:GNAT family N-acetyltransferase n=1 Tax=Streptacidiphilus sp. MAP12-16 TaxID=3156300 RepID=UPI00351895AB
MGETVAVREATSSDVDEAVALWTHSHVVRRNGRPLPEAHIDSAHQRMAAPGVLLLLAHETAREPGLIGTIIGVQGCEQDGTGTPIPGLLHISLLSVAPDRWGQHVGRLLVEEMLARAPDRGFDQAQLWTHADNLRANRLYKAMAFRRSGRVRVDDWGELLVHYRRGLTV